MAFYLLWAIAILLNLLFFVFTNSRKSGMRFLGWEFLWLALISLAIKLAGSLAISKLVAKNSEIVAKVAIPIVGNGILSYFLIGGLIYLLFGTALFTSSFMPKFNGKSLSQGV